MENKETSKTKLVALNTIAQIAGKVITTALSLYIIALLTRYLGVAGYGAYTTIFTYVGFWAVIADFGYYWVVVRELSKPNADQEHIFNNVITVKIIFAIVVFALSALVGLFIPQYSQMIKMGIAIIAISWFWMSLNSTYVSFFQYRLEMYKAAITEVVGRATIALGMYFLVKNEVDFYQVMWLYVLGNAVNFFLSYVLAAKYIKYRPRFDFKLWKMILRDSFPLALITFVSLINFKFDTIILSIQKSQTDVGIYGVPYKILEIIILIPSIFTGNVFPILTKYFNQKDNRFESAIKKSIDFLFFIGVPVVLILSILSTPIIHFIAGDEYITASTVSIFGKAIAAPQILSILSLSIGTTFLVGILPSLLTVINKQKLQVLPAVVVTLLNITANWFLIPRYSYLSASLVTLGSELLMFTWLYLIARKFVKIQFDISYIFRTLVAGLLMAFALFITKDLNLFISMAIGSITYLAAGFLLNIFDKNTIKQLIGKPNNI